jgi:hypothetical protein
LLLFYGDPELLYRREEFNRSFWDRSGLQRLLKNSFLRYAGTLVPA